MKLEKAKSKTLKIMADHGLLGDGWRFKFDNAVCRFGCCSWRDKTISLSKNLVELNNEYEVEQVILHEVAHALTKGHHHDGYWLSKARSIGYKGGRCYQEKDVMTPESKYIAICPSCNRIHKRTKKTRSISSCGFCAPRYDERFKLEYKENPKYKKNE